LVITECPAHPRIVHAVIPFCYLFWPASCISSETRDGEMEEGSGGLREAVFRSLIGVCDADGQGLRSRTG